MTQKLYTKTHAEAERAIVHTCLMAPERLTDIDLEPHQFAGPLWRDAWQVMRECEVSRSPIDPILVADTLRERGNSRVTPTDLIGTPESVGVVEALAERVKEAHIARSVAFACSQVLGSINDGKRGTTALDDALRELSAIDTGNTSQAVTSKEIVLARFQEFREMLAGGKVTTGIPTGLDALDTLLGAGLTPGLLSVVAARPGMGKSAFALAITRGAVAATCGVHIFSLEDIREKYADRLIAGATGVPAESLAKCDINAGELDLLTRRLPALLKSKPWLVDDRCGITAEEIVRSVRRSRKSNETKLVIVDYLTLIKTSSIGNTSEKLGHIMQVFADAAKQDRIHYMVLSQLNRELERRDNKRPIDSDLKASGDIEDKAKLILFLYRGEKYGDKDSNPKKVEIIVSKNNNGQTGTVEADWDAPTIRIY